MVKKEVKSVRYLYPPATPTILTNITSALMCVPELYQQVRELSLSSCHSHHPISKPLPYTTNPSPCKTSPSLVLCPPPVLCLQDKPLPLFSASPPPVLCLQRQALPPILCLQNKPRPLYPLHYSGPPFDEQDGPPSTFWRADTSPTSFNGEHKPTC